jgi:hypothetical protein
MKRLHKPGIHFVGFLITRIGVMGAYGLLSWSHQIVRSVASSDRQTQQTTRLTKFDHTLHMVWLIVPILAGLGLFVMVFLEPTLDTLLLNQVIKSILLIAID